MRPLVTAFHFVGRKLTRRVDGILSKELSLAVKLGDHFRCGWFMANEIQVRFMARTAMKEACLRVWIRAPDRNPTTVKITNSGKIFCRLAENPEDDRSGWTSYIPPASMAAEVINLVRPELSAFFPTLRTIKKTAGD